MSDNNNSVNYGIGFNGLLTIVFITLKLCNVINWSWWWVLSPIWIGWSLVAVFLFGFLAIAGIATGIGLLITWWDTRKRK